MSTYQFNSIGYHTTVDVADHAHAQAECVVPVQGSCLIHCDGVPHQVDLGQCIYIPAGCVHDQIDSDDCHSFYIKVSGLEQRLGNQVKLLSTGNDEMLVNWCYDLSQCSIANNEVGDAATAALLTAWIERLAYVNQVDQPVDRDPHLNKAQIFIYEHYPEDISLNHIASAVSVSVSHLGYLFRKYKQQSVMDYVREVRMHHARRLLLDDYRKIAEVGEMVGYADPNYFARQFRAVHGKSPRVWRQSAV